jgi:hypothetical protein
MPRAILYLHHAAPRIIPFGPAIRVCCIIRRSFERVETEVPLIVGLRVRNLNRVLPGSIVVASIRGALARTLIAKKTVRSAIAIREKPFSMCDRLEQLPSGFVPGASSFKTRISFLINFLMH